MSTPTITPIECIGGPADGHIEDMPVNALKRGDIFTVECTHTHLSTSSGSILAAFRTNRIYKYQYHGKGRAFPAEC